MEKKKIEKLYKLLERAEKERDTETAAALRWAIFQLESRQAEQIRLFRLQLCPMWFIMNISVLLQFWENYSATSAPIYGKT